MKLEKTRKKNYRLIITIIFVFIIRIIICYMIFSKSYALYEENKNFDVINGTVDDSGDIYFAYYIDGTISRNMPSQNTGYTLDEEKSNCNNGVIPGWDNAEWKFIGDYHNYDVTDNTRTKCTLYFNKTSKKISTILGNIEVNSYTPDFTKSACDDELCESHEKGIYETTDYDDNPTYYYRGSVENNYVKFAGFYWRIIRINSNGSLRVIYDGTTAHTNGESSEDRQYNTSRFNSTYTNNMYAGYMYTANEVHGTETSSIIKTNADKFYTDKLINYTSKIDNTIGYCGDRSTLSFQSDVGTGTAITYYKGYLRVERSTPTLSCEEYSDYYTVQNASNGNKKLTYPLGLISVDELILAGHSGGIFDGNSNYMSKNLTSYLTIGNNFWTMTPSGGTYPHGLKIFVLDIFFLSPTGSIDGRNADGIIGLRPVISIRSDVAITGTGTKTDPYIIN